MHDLFFMRLQMIELTQKYLDECLTYNKTTGNFYWKDRPRHHFKNDSWQKTFNRKNSGNIAGNHNANGYVRIWISGENYLAHRLVFLLLDGEWPLNVDHINGITNDNRYGNLRNTSSSINQRNRKLNKNNTSGVPGVVRRRNKWRAQITLNGVITRLGTYEVLNDAINARKQAEVGHGFHQNHGRQGI